MNKVVAGQSCVGRRVLVVEDETMIAMQLEDDLRDAGCDVVGPVPTVCGALKLIERAPLDAAIIDYHLADGDSGRIADLLEQRGVPFLFMTGHTAEDLPLHLRAKKLLFKPVRIAALVRELEALLGAADAPRS